MFNESSTAAERRHALQSLLSQGSMAHVGSGVSSPEQVNQLLARTSEEADLFQQARSSLGRTRGCAALRQDTTMDQSVMLCEAGSRVSFQGASQAVSP